MTMILLDTNVVSELMKPSPDANVELWMADLPSAGQFITSITEAELRLGVAMLPNGRRRNILVSAMEGMLSTDFADRILPFDSAAAIAYANVVTLRRKAGRPIAQFDAQIAAIARSHGASLATRNTPDFEACGIDLINPWKSPS